jgi:hypothetical protein
VTQDHGDLTGPRPSVSAVVLNHDYADYVLEAVQSLVDQVEPFDQVLVVDDGSTDDSVARLAEAFPGVRTLTRPNGGQLAAALTGLAEVTSDYVYFLDADDLALPELAGRVRAAVGSTRPVKVQFPLESVDAAGTPTGSVFPGLTAHYTAAKMREDVSTLGWYLCPPTSGNVYLVAALRGLPLDRLDPRDFIDGPPTLALPFHGEVVSLSQPLVRYRLHGSNHSQWGDVTTERLTGEIAWFRRRWDEATTHLGVPPLETARTGYELERQLGLAVLAGRPATRTTLALLRAWSRANVPTSDRMAVLVWLLLMLVPLPPLRRRVYVSRRAAGRRGPVTRAVVRVVRGLRRRGDAVAAPS